MNQHIAEKSKLCFSITTPNFCSRKGIYQMRMFVYKIVNISKGEATTHATFHDFWIQVSR